MGSDNSHAVPGPNQRSSMPAWTPEQDLLLGTMHDRDLARLFDCSKHVIRHRRHKLGIPPCRNGYYDDWTRTKDEILGTMPDYKVARRLKCSIHVVRNRRKKSGIPPCSDNRHQWTAEDDKLLGVRTDEEIARLLGISIGMVAKRRNMLKIPLSRRQFEQARRARTMKEIGGHNGRWAAEEDELLGTMPDEELARHLHRSVAAVAMRRAQRLIPKFDSRQRRWTPQEDALLGKHPDQEVARTLGRPYKAVHKRRTLLGIPVCRANQLIWTAEMDKLLLDHTNGGVAALIGWSSAAVHLRRKKLGLVTPWKLTWTPEEISLLGKMPDRDLADRLKRPFPSVRAAREVRKIPAFRRSPGGETSKNRR